MTADIFLTGDRSAHPVSAVAAVATVLAALPEGTRIATGPWGGIDAAVRYLVPDADVYGGGYAVDDYKPTFDDFKGYLAFARNEGVSRALVIHGDPFTSSIYKAAISVWTDDSAVALFP